MALRKIVVKGDPVLSKKAREITEITDRIKLTLEDMVETMKNANGVGLAAPQVGILRRMFVAEPNPDEIYKLINPEIIEREGEVLNTEACLSVPGFFGKVVRPEKIKLKALDENGNEKTYAFEGFAARVMCHEYDHLNGVLYTDVAKDVISEEEAARIVEEAEKKHGA